MAQKIRTLSLLLIIVLSFTSIGTVAAHKQSQSNGTVGEMHIEPNDKPRAGETTTMQLSFEDADRVTPGNCNCLVTIRDNQKNLYQTKLPPTGVIKFTFPKIGSYKVIVNGKSSGDSYPDFRLSYSVYVATAVLPPASRNDKIIDQLLLAMGGLLLLVSFALSLSPRRGVR